MDVFRIEGPVRLSGQVTINGSKNASLPIMAAAILAGGPSSVVGVPNLSDVRVFGELLGHLGCRVQRTPEGHIVIDSTVVDNPVGEYEIVRKMRASVCILGPLLARCGRAEVSMPGGCAIGDRPVNMHLTAMRRLGAEVELSEGDVQTQAKRLSGAEIFMGGPFGSTVTGTMNAMMAAVMAEGRTVLECAACEPEVADLANFLNACGANISGQGTPRVVIDGVDSLKGCE